MIDKYAGWQPLFSKIKILSEDFGVEIHYQPKAGYLRTSCPFTANTALTRHLDEIEELSAITCQFCGRPGAIDREHQQWIYIVCSNSTWLRLIDGSVCASCAF